MFEPDDPFGTVMNIDSTLGIPTMDVGSGGTHRFPGSFGEDAVGNLYIAYLGSGQVYRITTNQLLKGDFDADGDVDSDDYTRWRAGFGGANPNPAADGNGNSIFDAADYVAWRKNLGASVHAGAGASQGGAVPEPSAAAFCLVALAASVGFAQSHRRRRFVARTKCALAFGHLPASS
jgi:hypothetical protein